VRPKIADYPFTTLVPNLGVVSYDEGKSFVVADIPGLIEGAHQGHGLGDKFLRHVTRTSVLIHLLDGSRIDPKNPLADWSTINRELELFDEDLARKPQVVVVNKIDIPEARENAKFIEENLPDAYRPLYLISAVTGEGVRALVQKMGTHLERAKRIKEEESGDAARS
jgi:GTP-binding protein